MKNNRKLGQEQEEKAADILERMGYKILSRNYRCRLGEIDLIAKEKNTLVFVEVKYREKNISGTPEEAVTFQKQRRISKTAAWYLAEKNLPMDTPSRFDVVAITPEQVHIYKNAFCYVR